MSGDWKPGDVAITTRGDRIFRHGDRWITERPGWNGAKVAANHETRGARRLVVIDPEDAEQVERLLQLESAQYDVRLTKMQPEEVSIMQAALREFASPAPRIEEPQGLGAVVEDAQGHYWVRSDGAATRGTVWRFAGRLLAWRDLDVVRVLSEGVTP